MLTATRGYNLTKEPQILKTKKALLIQQSLNGPTQQTCNLVDELRATRGYDLTNETQTLETDKTAFILILLVLAHTNLLYF